MAEHEDRYIGARDLTRWTTPVGRFLVKWVRALVGWIGPHLALLLILVIGGGLAVTLTVLSTEVYEAVVESDGVAALDRPALQTAIAVRSPGLDAAVTAFTNLGGPVGMPILAGTATAILAFTRRSWTPVILMVTAVAGSLLMTVAGKTAVGRVRPPLDSAVPPLEHSPSFPSGHSLNSIVIAGVVAYLLVLRQRRKRTRALTIATALLFAVAMGLSRVYLGHHWLTDVVVAWTLGLAWLAMVLTIHRLLLTFLARRRHPG